RRAAAIIAVVATAFLAACESMGVGTAPVPPPPEIGLYELRTYTASPGKMAQLDARFRNHTIGLFRKHGMTPVGFFHVQAPAPPTGAPRPPAPRRPASSPSPAIRPALPATTPGAPSPPIRNGPASTPPARRTAR